MSREIKRRRLETATNVCGSTSKVALLLGVLFYLLGAVFAYSQDKVEARERKERSRNNK